MHSELGYFARSLLSGLNGGAATLNRIYLFIFYFVGLWLNFDCCWSLARWLDGILHDTCKVQFFDHIVSQHKFLDLPRCCQRITFHKLDIARHHVMRYLFVKKWKYLFVTTWIRYIFFIFVHSSNGGGGGGGALYRIPEWSQTEIMLIS